MFDSPQYTILAQMGSIYKEKKIEVETCDTATLKNVLESRKNFPFMFTFNLLYMRFLDKKKFNLVFNSRGQYYSGFFFIVFLLQQALQPLQPSI